MAEDFMKQQIEEFCGPKKISAQEKLYSFRVLKDFCPGQEFGGVQNFHSLQSQGIQGNQGNKIKEANIAYLSTFTYFEYKDFQRYYYVNISLTFSTICHYSNLSKFTSYVGCLDKLYQIVYEFSVHFLDSSWSSTLLFCIYYRLSLCHQSVLLNSHNMRILSYVVML